MAWSAVTECRGSKPVRAVHSVVAAFVARAWAFYLVPVVESISVPGYYSTGHLCCAVRNGERISDVTI